MKRHALAALVLAIGAMLASVETAMAAFQVVKMSATSGEPGEVITIRVDASLLIGGSAQSQLFLIPQVAFETSPEPARCDAIPGASVVGSLQWNAASVEFEGNNYPGFVGTGSFTVPAAATGIYVVSGIEDDEYTGCHGFTLFAIGMDLPDSATAGPGSLHSAVSLIGLALLAMGVLLARYARREIACLAR